MFNGDHEKIERIDISAEELEAAEYLLYCIGRNVEYGMGDRAGQFIRTMAEKNRELTVRAIAAAYIAARDARRKQEKKQN